MIVQFASKGSLRSILPTNFNSILWKDKISYLNSISFDLKSLHSLEYCHKDLHSGNILQDYGTFISEFGIGTPEFYKKLAYRCMNANPNQRPMANELDDILSFLWDSNYGRYQNDKYYGREIKEEIKEADKEIPNMSILYEKNPDVIYTSRAFKFINLPKPVNSSLITSYIQEEEENKQGNNIFNNNIYYNL